MITKSHFRLYSCSVPVRGKDESIICNLHNAGYTVIPHFLCELFQDFSELSIDELQTLYNDRDGSLVKYFNYLEEKQLGFYTNEPDCFPALDLEWHAPEKVAYAVLQIEDLNRLDYTSIIRQLDEQQCNNIDLWFTQKCDTDALKEILVQFDDSGIRSFDVYMPYSNDFNLTKLISFGAGIKKTADLVLYGAPSKKKMSKERIYFTPRKLSEKRNTHRNIPKDKFIIYIEFFTESIKYNPYYNRKVCIDKDGYLRNCLTHKKEFGNISTRNITDLLKDEAYTDLWYACNDKILEIQDSPFRYMWLNTHELEKTGDDTYRMLN